MSPEARLPDFIVIGAPKSGTTSFYHYLKTHPGIALSPRKETDYFIFGDRKPDFQGPLAQNLNRDSIYRWEDYLALFADADPGGSRVVGESSPRYLSSHEAPARVAARLPEVKLIALLRNPVDRAFSHYAMRVRDGWEPCGNMADAMADEARRIRANWASCIYLEPGYYARHLGRWLARFPREQLRIYLYEDFEARPQEVLQDTFGFLGVATDHCPDTSKRHNESGQISNPLWRFVWTRSHGLQRALRPLLPKALRLRISGFFTSRPKQQLEFSDDLRRTLIDVYREDITELQRLLGRDLSHWLS